MSVKKMYFAKKSENNYREEKIKGKVRNQKIKSIFEKGEKENNSK